MAARRVGGGLSIYVEIRIDAPLDEVWRHTQTPELHGRWDLRFSAIEYLPRAAVTDAQRFLYTTRIGLGLAISGEGESVGERDLADGSRTSALRFSSDHPLSLIREGSGYWKYVPTPAGVRFLTAYDYRTRFGALGGLVDRVVFRPLLGWATAWSFDRLRLWLERGIAPEHSARQAFIHGITRLALALVFTYHGLVPKLLGSSVDEITMLRNAGVPPGDVGGALAVFGLAELALALSLLLFWHRRWPALICGGFAIGSTIAVALTSPSYLANAFNPVTLNLAMGCLALIDLATVANLPSAARCRRRPAKAAP